ncbi:MAG: hypothetical protein ACXWDT_07985, partial [Solirubrobacterales bacterium]
RLLAEGDEGDADQADLFGAQVYGELNSPTAALRNLDERNPEDLLRLVVDDGARVGSLDVGDCRADADSTSASATPNENGGHLSRVLEREVDAALQRRQQTRGAGARPAQLTTLLNPPDELPPVKFAVARAQSHATDALRGYLRDRPRLRGCGDEAAERGCDPGDSGEAEEILERFACH